MYKFLKIVAIVLGLVGVVLCGGVLFGGVEPWADLLFWTSYVLLAIAIISVVIFGLSNILSSPKKIKKTLLFTGVFILVIIVSYLLASGKDSAEKWVGAGIISVYFFGGFATLLMLISGIKNSLTK